MCFDWYNNVFNGNVDNVGRQDSVFSDAKTSLDSRQLISSIKYCLQHQDIATVLGGRSSDWKNESAEFQIIVHYEIMNNSILGTDIIQVDIMSIPSVNFIINQAIFRNPI